MTKPKKKMHNEVARIIDDLNLDSSSFSQEETIAKIENPFNEVWTTVYSFPKELKDANNSTAVFACFASLGLEEQILDGQDWLKRPDSFSPGFFVCGGETGYSTGQDDGFEPIIIQQYFYPLEEGQLMLSQEFILLLKLYRDNDGNYYSIGESGEKGIAVRFDDSHVEIKTKFLMQYMSARQMLYVQFIDSRVSSPKEFSFRNEVVDNQAYRSDSFNYSNCYQSNKERTLLLSMIYARSIVRPEEVEKCDIWPYENSDEEYQDFIMGELPDGTFERFSCNPSRLGTYFGANPDAPHYLTPIYFRPEVLDKYRRNPIFEVCERKLFCGSQWGVAIDNVKPERVMVYLGDLGRDLPEAERKHFLQYELSPTDQSISEEVVAGDFFGMFVEETEGPMSAFFIAYRKMTEAWIEAFSWPLYREPHDDDAHIWQGIRIPTTNSPEEFETVIMNLARMLIDYIDESKLGRGSRDGSINKLEDFLRSKEISIDFSELRNLQKLRSAAVAHAKGKKYERQKELLLTGNSSDDIRAAITRLTEFLVSLAATIKPE